MVDLPASVIKTRGLLTLRGYKVDELFEYEDRYVMLPVKQSAEGALKSVVWIFKEAKVVGVAIVKDIARDMEEAQALEGVLVGGARFTPAARKFARASKVELVEGTYSSFDLFQHELVPKHTIVSDEEVHMVLEFYGIKKPQLPRILRDDPAAKVLGAKAGQVIRVERDSPTAGKIFYYRIVADSSR